MLNSLKESHTVLASEIIASPVPAGLTPEQETKIREGLAEMAKPFQDRAGELDAMVKTEATKQAATPDTLSTGMSAAVTVASATAPGVKAAPAIVPEAADRASLITKLHANPKDAAVLASLRDAYRMEKKERLASYFEGRSKQLQSQLQPEAK